MTFKLVLILKLSIVLMSLNVVIQAEPADVLWIKAQEQLHATSKYSPNEISIHTEFDEMGTDYDTLDSKTRLKGWENGKPIRKEIAFKETQKHSGLKFLNFDFGFIEIHGNLLDMLTIQNKSESSLNGQSCLLYSASAEFNNIPISAMVWIGTENALVLQVDYIFDVPKDPHLKSLSISTIFASTKDGLWLPKEMITKAELLATYHELTMNSRQTYESWTIKP